MMPTRQAVLLVGGKGTRLGTLTRTVPKPLMALDDDTVFLDEVIFDIARHGFDDIVLAAGYLAEQFVSRYHGKSIGGASIHVVQELEPAGTGGALHHVGHLLQPTFLFANGDTAFDINLRRLDALLNDAPDSLGVLALRRVADAGRYGSVSLEGNHVRSFREKQPTDGSAGLINGGIALFRREILDHVEQLPCSIETEVYPVLASQGRLMGAEFSGYFIDIGLPETLAQARSDLSFRRRRPTVFLDRDGVINHDSGYTWRPEDLRFIDGAVEAIRTINDMGALAIVVTNQAGIARGYYDHDDLAAFHTAIQAHLAASGAHIDAFYDCPYHPDATLPQWRHPDHPDRKPNPGMLLRAMQEWPIDPACSIFVGDKPSDMAAARGGGIAGLLFEGGNLCDFLRPHLAALLDRRVAPQSLG